MAPVRPVLVLLVTLAVIIGVALRFSNLAYKVYWFNEAFTGLRVSGFDEHEDANPRLYTGQAIAPADILVFQRPGPATSVFDTMRGLARKEPQVGPLYFILARLAVQVWDNTVVVTRAVAGLWSALGLLALFWLARELFDDRSVAWIAVGLAAVSPLWIRYAQEARPYSLWLALTLAASAALLRAMRRPTRAAWMVYAALVALALYAHLFTGLVMLAHVLYVLIVERGRLSPVTRAYGLGSLAGVIAFGPWLAVIIYKARVVGAVMTHLNQRPSLAFWLQTWALDASRLLVSWPVRYNDSLIYLTLPALLLLGYALYALSRHAKPRTGLFVTLFVTVPILVVGLADLLRGTNMSLQMRYVLPAVMGGQLAVAAWLAHLIARPHPLRARLGLLLTAGILSLGTVTSAVDVREPTWWGLSEVDVDLLHIFNQEPRTLVITDVVFGVIAPLSHQLNPDVRFLLNKRPANLVIPDGYERIYVYQPSDTLKAALRDRPDMDLRLVYQKPREDLTVYSLYQLAPR